MHLKDITGKDMISLLKIPPSKDGMTYDLTTNWFIFFFVKIRRKYWSLKSNFLNKNNHLFRILHPSNVDKEKLMEYAKVGHSIYFWLRFGLADAIND